MSTAGNPSINPLYEFYYSQNYIVLVNVARVAAIISIIASSAIIYNILQRKAHKNNTSNKLVFLMSICDIVWGLFANVLGTVLMPKGAAWGSKGTWSSCTAQGFITMSFLQPACFLNANLAIYYVICVRLGWREEQFHHLLIQFCLFGIPFVFGLFNSIWALVDGAYTIELWSCEFEPSPVGCKVIPEIVGECTSGLHADLIAQEWSIILIVLSFIILASVFVLYYTVLQRERANDRFRQTNDSNNRRLSNRVAMQGVYYSFCFLLTYSFYYVWFFGYNLRGKVPPYWLLVGIALTVPLQGLFTAFVFFRRNRPSDGELVRGIWASLSGSLRNSIFASRRSSKQKSSKAAAAGARHHQGTSTAVTTQAASNVDISTTQFDSSLGVGLDDDNSQNNHNEDAVEVKESA